MDAQSPNSIAPSLFIASAIICRILKYLSTMPADSGDTPCSKLPWFIEHASIQGGLMKFTSKRLARVMLLFFSFSALLADGTARSADIESLQRDIQVLQQRLEQLEQKLEETKKRQIAETRAEVIADAEAAEEEQEIEETAGVVIGGALRYNYAYRDFSDTNEAKAGDLEFDIFRVNVDGQYKDVIISAEYRWYSYQDVIHHGYVGYNFNDSWQGQVGVTQVPFGILPYASHNWWFGIPYYVGFEDDYDMGVKTIWKDNGWNLQLGFFKNGEWGNSSKLERYSYDIVSSLQSNEETNQLNARLAYLFDHGSLGSTELGLSSQWGQLYNSVTDDKGEMWAAALHLVGDYGPFNVMLEAVSYDYDPENPVDTSDATIEMGAFGVSSLVAAEGEIYLAGISYDVPVSWGPISKLTFYNDYSILVKNEDYPDSQINTTGVLITAGPLFVYVDYILGRNAQFLGGGSEPFGAAGDSDDDWNSRFNINVGYYF